MTLAEESLQAQNQAFEKQIVELSSGIWTAIGYAASNVHLIEAGDQAILIDTTESTSAAAAIFADLQQRSSLPIQTIIYTHSHRDHISGAKIFAGDNAVEIIAASNFSSDLIDDAMARPVPAQAIMKRTRGQFGIGLSHPDELINIGIGPGNRPLQGLGAGYLPPTRWVQEKGETMSIGTRTLRLQPAPGETADHIIVWLEQEGVLFCGDNYYQSFPNLYAIRGTAYRDYEAWVDTLDDLLGFEAEALAPGHTMPVFGQAAIRERLTDYRNAIRHVVDRTIEGMNQGLTPDALVEIVSLPSDLAAKPWLQEFYGKLEWAVRGYYAGTMGWFDGKPSRLFPLSPAEEAQRVAELVGGPKALLEAAQAASGRGDHQWALQLADHLDHFTEFAGELKAIRRESYKALARHHINACARNYYLTAANDL